MQYLKFKPQDILLPYVECYFTWESEGPLEAPLEIESPPTGYCSIVINFGSPYFLKNKKYEKLAVPPQFVSGQSIYSYKLSLSGQIGIAGIVLKPAALSTLFGIQTFELTEERIDLFQLLPQSYVRENVARVREATGPQQRVKYLEEILLHHLRISRPEPDYIDTAVELILQKNGLLNVNDLLKDSCMSRRTFERRFFQKVGLSPKYFARVRRIGYICNLIVGKKKVNWAEVFYEAEFYDQAHFIKDFEAFTGRSPQQYLEENLELGNLVEKPRAIDL